MGSSNHGGTTSYFYQLAITYYGMASTRELGICSTGSPFQGVRYSMYRISPGRGVITWDITQTPEELDFARNYLEEGCASGIYQNISLTHSMRAKKKG